MVAHNHSHWEVRVTHESHEIVHFIASTFESYLTYNSHFLFTKIAAQGPQC